MQLRKRVIGVGITAAAVVTAVTGATVASASSAATGGETVYQVKKVAQNIPLGSSSNPTTLAVKSVPAGKYLVTGLIGVGSQPGSFIVCALSNSLNGNDGVFGTYVNQTSDGAQANVQETEILTVPAGGAIHLTCDDNNGKAGETVGEVVVEATAVSALH
jgi:hypothetical protein